MASVAQIVRRRRRREARRTAARTQKRAWTILVAVVLLTLVILPSGAVVGGTAVLYLQASSGLPAPQDSIVSTALAGVTELYDRTGQTLIFAVQDPLGARREWVRLSQLPRYVIDATLISEDPAFLTATHFNPISTATRLWMSVLEGRTAPDPSLTGRLVRNVILPTTYDPTREIALVSEINRLYTPEQILEWHLNTNDYGSDAYGIEAAAQVYLGKSAADLTLDEAALLAAIPTAPQYNPFDNETAARGRQQDTLRALLRAGLVDQTSFDAAMNALTPVREDSGELARVAPDFARYAREQAEDILDSMGLDGARLVARGGLRITTTLDLDLYDQSECALRTHLARLNGQPGDESTLSGGACASLPYLPAPAGAPGDSPPNAGALVVLDATTGEVKSIVGEATLARYEPGPVLQPFVYITGFRSALYSPASMVLDIPRPFPGAREGLIYTPANPDNRFRGPMNLRDAMGAGLLPPAADVAYRQGMDNILRVAHQIGLNSLDLGVYDLMLLERDGEVSALDVAYAYSVFASLGNMRGVSVEPVANGYRGRDPVAVLRIEDGNGSLLWEYNEDEISLNNTNVMQAELAYLVNDVLSDQETRWSILGENNVLDLPRQSAVVNGLTGDRSSNWTVGYTPQLVTGVWLGREEGGAFQPVTLDPFGLSGAAMVWRAVMEYAHNRDGLPPDEWERPERIVQLQVCERSGMLPNGDCPARDEIFLDGTQVRLQPDTFWQSFQVNSQTGQLATANTPPEFRSERVFFVPPPEAADWWQANNLPLPPTEYDTVSRPELFGSAAILQPEPFAYVGGVVDIRGSVSTEGMQFFQLAYGQGLNPSQWTDIGGQQTSFVRGGSLGAWDTSALDGLYSLRLNVVMADNTIDTQVIQVTVDNTPPAVTLSAGEPGAIYRYPGDVIPLEAAVEDNLAIARAEFYHNGQFVGTDTDWPYGFDWETTGAGVENFSVTVFDAAGNSASADVAVEVVRAG